MSLGVSIWGWIPGPGHPGASVDGLAPNPSLPGTLRPRGISPYSRAFQFPPFRFPASCLPKGRKHEAKAKGNPRGPDHSSTSSVIKSKSSLNLKGTFFVTPSTRIVAVPVLYDSHQTTRTFDFPSPIRRTDRFLSSSS
jgi:hypothetical protein